MYELYKYNKNSKNNIKAFKYMMDDNLKLVIRKVSLPTLLIFNHFFVDLYWLINTRGNCWVYSVYDGDKEVYHTYITKKCYKFPFMKNNDLQISNTFTVESYRNRGINKYVKQIMIQDFLTNYPNSDLYSLVDQENIVSQKQNKKLGFKKTGRIITKKLFGIINIYHTPP